MNQQKVDIKQEIVDTNMLSLANSNLGNVSNNNTAFEESNGPVIAKNDMFGTMSNNQDIKDTKLVAAVGKPPMDIKLPIDDEDSDISEESKQKRRFNFNFKNVFSRDGSKNNLDTKSRSSSTLLSKFRKLTIVGKKDTKLNHDTNLEVDEDSISYNGESPCPYGCKNCGASFDQVSALATHIKKGHCRTKVSRKVNSVFSTDWDDLSVDRSRSQSISERAKSLSNKHMKERADFECKICNKKFSYKWNLQRHMKVHDTEKKFACEVCGKKFRHKGNVKIHMAKHTKEERYQCTKCGRKFSWHSSLKRHRCIPKI